MDLDDLLNDLVEVPVKHRGRTLTVTCRPELLTPRYKAELLARTFNQAEQRAELLAGEGAEPEAAPIDSDTKLILDVATGWDMKRGGQPVALNAETLGGLSYGLRWAIVRAISLESQNPTSAPA